jgi:H+-transporting ATPase
MYSGLSSSQAKLLLKKNGFNELPQKSETILHKLIKNVVSPISCMLLVASGLSFVLGKAFDGSFILILLLANIVITVWQESKADNAIKKLNESLEQKVQVLRDSKWQTISSKFLVQEDIIKLTVGEIIPVDGVVVEANHVSVNESALSGESLPKDKNIDDPVSSGTFIVTGVAVVKVTATGVATHFGKTIHSVEKVVKKSLLEKDVINISKFLTLLSVIAVVILNIVFLIKKASFIELLTLDLSLVIAGIPISLPTVMTLIIEFGVLHLAKKDVIVRRLSSLEDLANVTFLLTDKTGTLTKNKISIRDIYSYDGFTHDDVLLYASVSALSEGKNPIDDAILEKVKHSNIHTFTFRTENFTPADSDRKRSTVQIEKDNKKMIISVGAPNVIEDMCAWSSEIHEKFKRDLYVFANHGYRTLAVAMGEGEEEKNLKIVGLLALSDTLRSDAKSVVEFLEENGIGVSMVTGDNRAIASQIAKELHLHNGKVITKEELDQLKWDAVTGQIYMSTGAFAEILPQDKLKLVQKAKEYFIVASNGDGVNDLPAIKAAQVGIAVKSAVDALKQTADIVLMSEGISVIRDAIIESRKIFERVYIYSLYRISESLRLIITIAILGIFYGVYPLTALQLILIALLNDIPIISLAFDKVKVNKSPSKIEVKKRFILSSLYGLVGVCNSILLFILMKSIWHLNWETIQTMYFLKLTVSGHLLIFVAHTKERWWKFLPSKEVLSATITTQLVATLLAITGFLMPTSISIEQAFFVWIWAFFWMQASELMKKI